VSYFVSSYRRAAKRMNRGIDWGRPSAAQLGGANGLDDPTWSKERRPRDTIPHITSLALATDAVSF